MAEPDYTENGIVVPDIVTRLRDDESVFVDTGLLHEAADEIERLRTAGDALLAALRDETVNGAMAVCDGTNEAMEAWEARRG